MSLADANPFKAHSDWEHNACVEGFMGFDELARYYIRSADALVSCAVDDHSLLDVHVYSICFLYRHAIELILKDLAWKSEYLLKGEKRFAQNDWKELGRHRLQDIWSTVKPNALALLRADFPIDNNEVSHLEGLFGQVQEHDRDSFAFRYPIGKTGRTHPSLRHVDVRALHGTVHQAFDCLEKIGALIGDLYDQQAENEHGSSE
jgi:hypothetical protein